MKFIPNYTDADYIRLAGKLGIEHFVRNYHWCFDVQKTGTISGCVLMDGFRDWLLSPEGRCAIEDWFIERGTDKPFHVYCYNAPDDGSDEYIVYQRDDRDEDSYYYNNSINYDKELGHGPTPAEAWLDAAMNVSKEEGK